MKRLIGTTITALLLAANMAVADGGFSLGVSAVQADVSVNNADMNVNGDVSGWRLFGLYKFNERFGIEGGVTSYDRPDDPSIPSNVEAEHESYDLYAVGTLPVTEKLDLFGKMGFVSSETELEEDELNEVSTTSTDLALAFGGEYQLTRKFSLRGEYQWVDSKNTGAGDLLSLSGVFSFGKN